MLYSYKRENTAPQPTCTRHVYQFCKCIHRIKHQKLLRRRPKMLRDALFLYYPPQHMLAAKGAYKRRRQQRVVMMKCARCPQVLVVHSFATTREFNNKPSPSAILHKEHARYIPKQLSNSERIFICKTSHKRFGVAALTLYIRGNHHRNHRRKEFINQFALCGCVCGCLGDRSDSALWWCGGRQSRKCAFESS